jgi:hypothetical protein
LSPDTELLVIACIWVCVPAGLIFGLLALYASKNAWWR